MQMPATVLPDVGGDDIELTHHLYQIGGRTGAKPVVGQVMVLECVEQAVGVEQVG